MYHHALRLRVMCPMLNKKAAQEHWATRRSYLGCRDAPAESLKSAEGSNGKDRQFSHQTNRLAGVRDACVSGSPWICPMMADPWPP